jgi:hypothetical protein
MMTAEDLISLMRKNLSILLMIKSNKEDKEKTLIL